MLITSGIICFISFLFLFNAYFIAKLIIRWNLSINGYLATAWGFFAYFLIHFFTFVILYLANANVLTYLIFIAVIQLLLLTTYIWNYKYAFVTYKIKFKTSITFISLVALCALIVVLLIIMGYKNGANFFLVNDRNSQQFLVLSNLSFNKDLTVLSIIKFYGDIFNFHYFSCLSIFSVCIQILFHVTDPVQISHLLFWEYVPIYLIIFGCVFSGTYYLKINEWTWNRIGCFILLSSLIPLISLLFFACPTAGDVWLPLLLVIYLHILFKCKYISDLSRNILLVSATICLGSFDVNLTLIETILIAFTYYYCMKKNLNPTGYLLWMVGPYLICFTMWFSLLETWIYISLISIIFGSTVILISILLSGTLEPIIDRLNRVLVKHSLFFLITLISVIYVVAIFLFITLYDYRFETSLWNYKYILTIVVNNSLLNAITWGIYAFVLLITLSFLLFKRQITTNWTNSLLTFFIIVLFFNPISLNIFLKLQTPTFTFDISLINWLIIVPIINTINHQIDKVVNKQI